MGIEVELQRALFTILNAAKATLGVKGVYDVAPQSADGGSVAAFPYVTVGSTVISAYDTTTDNGFEATMRIHTFSRTGSMLECKTIQGKIYAALHDQPLSVTGFSNFLMLRTSTDCFSDQDGKAHGVCEYRALIETA